MSTWFLTKATKPATRERKVYSVNGAEPGMVVHTCNPSYSRGRGRGIMSSRPALTKVRRACLKNKIQSGGVAQVEKHLSVFDPHCHSKLIN
jgi:hypothetical protein